MPKPLSSFSPKPGVIATGNFGQVDGMFGSEAATTLSVCNACDYPLESRTRLGQLALRVISSWAILDSYVARTFAAMVGGVSTVAVAMYLSLGSSNLKQQTLTEASKVALKDDPTAQRVLQALLDRYRRASKNRNKVAHQLWGLSDAAPDGIILMDARELLQFQESVIGLESIMVYDESDFTQWIDGIEDLSEQFHHLMWAVDPDDSRRGELLGKLSRELGIA